MGVPIIYNGNFAKLLKDDLKFRDTARIITISVDPTSVATEGEAGSIAMRNNGSIYVKQDAGTTTNWILNSAFNVNTILVNQDGDVLTNGTNVLVTG